MPEIVYHVATSLDGFIADQDGKVDWLNDFNDQETTDDCVELQKSFDGIVLGGHTYDFVLAHGQWMSPGIPSWVFTRRDLEILDPCIQLTQESPRDIFEVMNKQGLKRVWLMGGGQLAASFFNVNLVNRVELAITPVFLGKGIPIIGKTSKDPKLTLTKTRQFSNGIVRVSYEVR